MTGLRRGRNALLAFGVFALVGCTTQPSLSPTASPSPSPASTVLAKATAPPNGITRALVSDAGTFAPAGMWLLAEGDKLLLSTDGGASWSTTVVPTDPTSSNQLHTILDVLDADHVWALTGNDFETGVSGDMSVDRLALTVHRSVDGGRTWEEVPIAGNYPGSLQALRFIDAEHGVLLIAAGRFDTQVSTTLTTADGGRTWTVAGSAGVIGTQLTLVDATTIWAGSAAAEAFPRKAMVVSHDGGHTWVDVNLPGVPKTFGQFVSFPQPLIFTGSTGVGLMEREDGSGIADVIRSDDAGETWARISTTTARSLAVLSREHWLRPGDQPAEIEATDDGGETWTSVATAGLPPVRVEWIKFADQLHGAVLVTAGLEGQVRLYVTSDGGTTWHAPGFWAVAPDPAVVGRGRVEVINGPRQVIVSIATDRGAWMWLVPPGARMTLLDEAEARPGGIEIIGDGCELLGTAAFGATPFTIVLDGPATGGRYTLRLDTSTSLTGPANTDYYGLCSG
jgi:photosystem II stability/assembly factor-like uncharacterized protein